MDLYIAAVEKIVEKPILGWGLCGSWENAGLYPHNIFLEIWLAFGVILGSLVIMLLAIYVMAALLHKKGNHRSLIIIYLALVSELLVSGSVWSNVSMWILIALCLSRKKEL